MNLFLIRFQYTNFRILHCLDFVTFSGRFPESFPETLRTSREQWNDSRHKTWHVDNLEWIGRLRTTKVLLALNIHWIESENDLVFPGGSVTATASGNWNFSGSTLNRTVNWSVWPIIRKICAIVWPFGCRVGLSNLVFHEKYVIDVYFFNRRQKYTHLLVWKSKLHGRCTRYT